MLDLKYILKNIDEVKQRLHTRGFDTKIIDEINTLAKHRSESMISLQNLEALKNSKSKEIGILKQQNEDSSHLTQEVNQLKEKLILIKEQEQEVNQKISKIMLEIPNLPSLKVPVGTDETFNQIIGEHSNLGRGKVTQVLPHFEIAEKLKIVDFERAVKISGTRFWSYTGQGARLVRALINFMLDTHTNNGYHEINPPLLVKSEVMQGTGQLPKFGEDSFKLENEDLWLIPTAEVPLTNFYSNEIVDLNTPIKLTGYTPCFRSEAGSTGRDTRGIIRGKQFHKVEIVKIVTHDDLQKEFKSTVNDAKRILELLELPFQELQLCTGDIGFSSEETIDLEVWIPSEKKYREISSVSSFSDFQGRRASIRYKKDGKNFPVCTINGSGLAIDRTIAAILENYQNPDGSITIPSVLQPYFGSNEIKPR